MSRIANRRAIARGARQSDVRRPRALGKLAASALVLGAGASAALVLAGPNVPDARADDASAAAAVTGSSCSIKGTAPVPKGTQLFDAPTGGRLIGSFTGGLSPLLMSDLPADPTSGRAKVSTSTDGASFRVDGFAQPSKFDTFSARDLGVSNGHVWISTGQKVRLVHAGPNALTAELIIAGSQSQTVRATATCDAFSFKKGPSTPMQVDGQARGFLMKTSALDLFDDAGGSVVLRLAMIEGAAHLFWSTETKAGFVHVQMRADVTIDAWARLGDLDPLKKGEMMDQLISPSSTVTGAQLALDKPPPVARATREVPIRATRSEKDKPIGAVEVGADIFVMETIGNFTNVLPKSLGIMPPDGEGFWIPSSEVPR